MVWSSTTVSPVSYDKSAQRFVGVAVSKIVFVYAAFAGLWILVSDQVVISLFSDPKSIGLISTIKGWLFVAVTSLLLAILIRRYLNKLAEANVQLRISEERWKFALEGAEEGVWDWNIQTGVALYSTRWKEMLGYAETEIENKASEWSSRVHPEDMPKVMATIQAHIDGKTPSAVTEFRLLCRDGSWLWTLGRGMVVSRDADGKALRLVGTNTDITERKQMESQIVQLAFHDPLTQLPNRRLLKDRLSQIFATTKRSGCYGAVMFLDLDDFKPLNDTYGHEVGDSLLIEVADRLRSCVREVDTVGRFGGDEFLIMLGELNSSKDTSTTQARIVAEKVCAVLAEPYRLKVRQDGMTETSIEYHCTVSIGVVLFIDHETSQDDILKWADSAMYQAKENGGNQIRFHG